MTESERDENESGLPGGAQATAIQEKLTQLREGTLSERRMSNKEIVSIAEQLLAMIDDQPTPGAGDQ